MYTPLTLLSQSYLALIARNTLIALRYKIIKATKKLTKLPHMSSKAKSFS
jgi:hypothetical protein